jgi:hypothetical protein
MMEGNHICVESSFPVNLHHLINRRYDAIRSIVNEKVESAKSGINFIKDSVELLDLRNRTPDMHSLPSPLADSGRLRFSLIARVEGVHYDLSPEI